MTSFDKEMAAWGKRLAERQASDRTRRLYLEGLQRFRSWWQQDGRPKGGDLDLDTVKRTHVMAYCWWMEEEQGLRPATVNQRLSSLRAYYRYRVLLQRREPIADPTLDVRPSKSQQQDAPRSLSKQAQKALLVAAERAVDEAVGKCPPVKMTGTLAVATRNRALLHTMLYAGLRLGEVCALEISDLDLEGARARIRVRNGKGNKERTVAVDPLLRETLEDWLRVRNRWLETNEQHRQSAGDAVFVGRRGDRISYNGVSEALNVLARLTQKLGPEVRGVVKLDPKDVSPHTLRHSCAKNWVDAGQDLTKVQRQLGHERIATTARYTTATMEDLEASASDVREKMDALMRD